MYMYIVFIYTMHKTNLTKESHLIYIWLQANTKLIAKMEDGGFHDSIMIDMILFLSFIMLIA